MEAVELDGQADSGLAADFSLSWKLRMRPTLASHTCFPNVTTLLL